MTRPLHTKSADGTDLLSPAGLLLLAVGAAYDANHAPEGRKRGNEIVMAMLNAAHAGGFKNRDVLHTLLSRGERSERVRSMAQHACDAIPNVMEVVNEALHHPDSTDTI